jgi:hypothetical protein
MIYVYDHRTKKEFFCQLFPDGLYIVVPLTHDVIRVMLLKNRIFITQTW